MSRPKAVVKLVRVVSYVHPTVLAAFEREAGREKVSLASLVARVLTVGCPR